MRRTQPNGRFSLTPAKTGAAWDRPPAAFTKPFCRAYDGFARVVDRDSDGTGRRIGGLQSLPSVLSLLDRDWNFLSDRYSLLLRKGV
ncbi:MAG: hypothetical protein ACLSAP_01615 [Oscillospiraceae bacterium]